MENRSQDSRSGRSYTCPDNIGSSQRQGAHGLSQQYKTQDPDQNGTALTPRLGKPLLTSIQRRSLFYKSYTC
ncbi:hypothetical protein [Pontibacter sp. HJ8]